MQIRELIALIKEDINQLSESNLISKILTFYFNMSFKLLLNYRIGYFLVKRRNRINNLLILMLRKRQIKYRNCDISYNAVMGRRVKFPHPLGIVIGEKVIIGDDVMIWQDVTLGSHGKDGFDFSYPIIENNVKLYAGCKIIGEIVVGQNAVVAANAVVIRNVAKNEVVGGIPAKKLK